MTVDLDRYYEQSYPPSVLGGGGAVPVSSPAPMSGPPTQNHTKAEIVAWLLGHGATISEDELMAMTKAEQLLLVEDLAAEQQEPEPELEPEPEP